MTLKVQILQSFRRLLIILLGLMMTLFSEKMFISNICIHGLMPNFIKKSWTVSNQRPTWKIYFDFSICDISVSRRTGFASWYHVIYGFDSGSSGFVKNNNIWFTWNCFELICHNWYRFNYVESR